MNKDKIRESRKKYRKENSEKVRKWQKKWREENKDHIKNYKRDYRKNNKIKIKQYLQKPEVKEKRKKCYTKANKKHCKKYPERIKARNMARSHIKIPKGQLCEECNKNLAKERHHEDYSKPLEVILVCGKCHNKLYKLIT